VLDSDGFAFSVAQEFVQISFQSLGSVMGYGYWPSDGHHKLCLVHAKSSKKHKATDLQFTLKQIGLELGKIYQQPKRLPRRLRAVFMQLERRVPARRGRHWEKGNDKH
jgi:hypothetical protein